MPWMRWLPWRFFVRHITRAHGFLDPIPLLSRLQRFAEPAEVGEPIELLRAGVVFHARGLINSRVIQHNLDWVWPYWIEQQFNPGSDSFIPRAFSLTHVNLTHRNWTAIGHPDCEQLPIVDPRGLLTPLYDGWSIDVGILSAEGFRLLPSRAESCAQTLEMDDGLSLSSKLEHQDLSLQTLACVKLRGESLYCESQVQAVSKTGGWLIVLLRPYNPEGISFIHRVELLSNRSGWLVDGTQRVEFNTAVDRHHVSDYKSGDVLIHLQDLEDQEQGVCDVGMVTAAAMFKLQPSLVRDIEIALPIAATRKTLPATTVTSTPGNGVTSWQSALQGCCRLSIADTRMQSLYDAALRTLILLSPEDVYPGPYTYKRFWFRDAAFMIHALLCVGMVDRAERALDRFPQRQASDGYFHSQEGEWDANGQVLWIMQRFCQLTATQAKPAWRQAIEWGARWISRKRRINSNPDQLLGLLPAGFSAEHLGPIDYYYWDNFWGIAGLQAADFLCAGFARQELAQEFRVEADNFQNLVDTTLERASARLHRAAMPAAPTRRLDAGAIGSLVAGYPLQLYAADDPRLLDSVEFLLSNCFVAGGFFQDMIHSGINPYLSLHVAQILLRAGDPRYLQLMQTVAELASTTGQWPEAIHPRTGGGCMGDGQHGWAAAEWILMIRECFIRETDKGLILGSGIASSWFSAEEAIRFGPAPTPWGTVSLEILLKGSSAGDKRGVKSSLVSDSIVQVSVQAEWFAEAAEIEVQIPGYEPGILAPGQQTIELPIRASNNVK